MSEISDALDKALSDHGAKGAGQVTVKIGGLQATVDVADVDRIGVVVEQVKVVGPHVDVAKRAAELATCLRPGGDRLVAVEVDPGMGGASLRTDPVEIRDGRFFQVDVDQKGVKVTRHKVSEGGQRTPERFSITREQLGTMVDQISGESRAGSNDS